MITPELLAQVRRLTIRSRRAVEEVFSGAYRSAFRGHGLEFAEVREYVPGDDIRAIDWNVTARVGRPFIKRFDEERELTVVVAIDLSGSLAFGSRARKKREAAAEAGALVALAAARNRDRVGLLLFTDHRALSPAVEGARSPDRPRRAVSPGTGTDLAQASRSWVACFAAARSCSVAGLDRGSFERAGASRKTARAGEPGGNRSARRDAPGVRPDPGERSGDRADRVDRPGLA